MPVNVIVVLAHLANTSPYFASPTEKGGALILAEDPLSSREHLELSLFPGSVLHRRVPLLGHVDYYRDDGWYDDV